MSKGAELRHRNLTANIRQLISWFSPAERTESFLAALPLFHVFGMTVTQNICLAVGGCMVLVPGSSKYARSADSLLRKKKPTVVTLVPATGTKASRITVRRKTLLRRGFSSAAGPHFPYELLKKFKERTGHLIVEGYGLSEASPVTHCNIPRGLSVKRSIGLPIANTEAKIVDETGQEVPVGGDR